MLVHCGRDFGLHSDEIQAQRGLLRAHVLGRLRVRRARLRRTVSGKLYSYVAHSPAASSGHSSKNHAVFTTAKDAVYSGSTHCHTEPTVCVVLGSALRTSSEQTKRLTSLSTRQCTSAQGPPGLLNRWKGQPNRQPIGDSIKRRFGIDPSTVDRMNPVDSVGVHRQCRLPKSECD